MGKIITLNTNFSSVSVEKVDIIIDDYARVQKEINSALLLHPATTALLNTSGYKGAYLINSGTVIPSWPYRATVVIPYYVAIEGAPYSQNDFDGVYEHICIPTETINKIKISMTDNRYYFGLAVFWDKSGNNYDSGWVQGGNYTEFDIASYFQSQSMSVPEKIWLASTLKIGSAGNTAFTNETLSSIGYSIELTYNTPSN